MGRRSKGRQIDGVVLLDKPLNLSSNDALQRVRQAFDARKGGHTGSLDPLATGLLPICLGEATKLSSYLLSASKRYRVTACVGHETETGDLEGAPTSTSQQAVPPADAFERLLETFRGDQTQIPPMYSALKVNGKPLYAYARAGQVIAREPRPICIEQLACVDRASDRFSLDVTVSGGTYIRTLVEDIARAFDGRAHVVELRRTGVGALGMQYPMVTLDTLQNAAVDAPEALGRWLYPLSMLVSDWPSVGLDAAQAAAIAQGQRVDRHSAPCDADTNDVFVLRTQAGVLGIGFLDADGRLAPKRLFARPQI
ncbi:MAG: tRNA pseudouridine(55) synthase TruB [Salinisphaera sp.]|nr:tRNA pseudouridine(55) synthase TruB [Salinisphaera sp.]